MSPGDVAHTVDESLAIAERIGYPVVVKAQVQVGGRGKAGGIKLANNKDEVRTHAGNIIGMSIKGHVVKRVWIERASDIAEEYYASFTLDRAAKQHLLMLSAQGGVDIEEVAAKDPSAIVKLHVNPVVGLDEATAKRAAVDAKIPAKAQAGVASILVKLYGCFVKGDCDLAEINPLILKPTGEVHALDAKVSSMPTRASATLSGKSSPPRKSSTAARNSRARKACSTSVSTAASASSPTVQALR